MSKRSAVLAASDLARLRRFLAAYEQVLLRDREQLAWLGAKCEQAVVVEPSEVPQTTITLRAQVRLRDLDSGRTQTCTVALPSDAQIASRHLAPFSWLGAVLIGLREGDKVQWQSPSGTRRLQVEKVLYQPQAVRRRLNAFERKKRQLRTNHGTRSSRRESGLDTRSIWKVRQQE